MIYQRFTKDLPKIYQVYQTLTNSLPKYFFNLPRIYHRFTNTFLGLNIFLYLESKMLNKGCTREFLYIRNSHPRLKLTLIAEKCTAGMHVNTHSCPLRTQKLTIIHGFLPRLTLTSEGGELVNPQKTKIHNETQKICVISLRRSRGRMILNARKC